MPEARAPEYDKKYPSPYFRISSNTEGAYFKYTTDGSDPNEDDLSPNSDNVVLITSGTPTTIKVRAFKSGMTPSDIATKTYTPVTMPMALPDGSVLFYDRGSTYGEYCIGDDGYPVRLSDGVDDGSSGSAYWRYLICDKNDVDDGTKQWGPYGINEGMTDVKYEDMGYGLPNTNAMIAKYATNTSYWWRLIKEKRDNTGLDWFMPSKDELDMMYDNRTVITGQGGDAFKTDTYYWSSSELSSYGAWYQDFPSGGQVNLYNKNYTNDCRLLRRV